MKKLLLCLLLSLGFLGVYGQPAFFAYFQTEDSLPFYIKMSEQVYRSGSQGSLTLSNLADSNYIIVLGMPDLAKEYRYAFRIDGSDQGYGIRNQDGEPVLVGLINGNLLRPQRLELSSDITYVRRTDAFSARLAKATGDTTVLYQAVYAKVAVAAIKDNSVIEDRKPALNNDITATKVTTTDTGKVETPVSSIAEAQVKTVVADTVLVVSSSGFIDTARVMAGLQITNDSAGVVNTDANTRPFQDSVKNTKPHPVADTNTARIPLLDEKNNAEQEVQFARSLVTRYAESSTSDGFSVIFIDQTPSGIDTVRLLIPNPRFVIQRADSLDPTDASPFIVRKELDSLQKLRTSALSSDSGRQQIQLVVKQDCKAQASDNDFFKLRKAMASKETDEGMIDEARKAFRTRCFTTKQIKNLGTLFLTSAGKFQFFETAYPRVSDREQFKTLASELVDGHYLQRFQSLIGE